MPTVICPGCGRNIDLPESDLFLSSITCSVCETAFCPAPRPAPAYQAPLSLLSSWGDSAGQHWYDSPMKVFVLIVAALLTVELINFVLFMCFMGSILHRAGF